MFQRRRKEVFESLYQDAVFQKLGRDYQAEFQRAMDAGDRSVIDLLQSVGLKLVDIRQEELAEMSIAERKLDDGTYGSCDECGKEIGEERLAALPYAVYCIDCAQKHEQAHRKEIPTL
jgi:DnaK suppressor protein